MITIQIDGKKYIPSETLGGITRVPEMIQHYIEFGALEEVKENKEPTVHIPNDGKKYMINGELYNPQANSILEKLREELDKIYKDRIDKNYEENSPEHYKAYGQYLMYQRLYYFLNSLEQPKEEPQPPEDIELLPKFDEYLSTTECIKLRVFSLEVQVELLTSTVNQLIKANKK